MKSIIRSSVLLLAVLLVCPTAASAQGNAKDAPAPAAQQVTQKSIFDYKKELAITDRQEKSMRGMLKRLQESMAGRQKELTAYKADLDKLIADKAGMRKIRAAIDKVYKVYADANYEDIMTGREIEGELTADQLSKWRKIQEDNKKTLQEALASGAKAQ